MSDVSPFTEELLRKQVYSLPPSFAQLYTNFALVSSGRPGPPTWTSDEARRRETDGFRLAGVGYSMVRARRFNDARNAFRRGAELFEWLTTDQSDDGYPYDLVSALLYQLAGYPAMARTMLDRETDFLSFFVEGAFESALDAGQSAAAALLGSDINSSLTDETESVDSLMVFLKSRLLPAINLICAHLRWGGPEPTESLAAIAEVARYFTYADDDLSWLLARLLSETATRYARRSLRTALIDVVSGLATTGRRAIERYCRQAYSGGRALAWTSQQIGIRALTASRNFALVTPTGSGKTTIAEIAIIQSLFEDEDDLAEIALGRLVLYIVPSRALAAQVERRLSQTFREAEHFPISVVTSYSGAADSSPLESWLASPLGTVIVCTQEKADALARSSGDVFLNRVRLIVIDEAHDVQVQAGMVDERALRLEQLIARFRALSVAGRARVIALSAVTPRADKTLASWVDADKPTRIDADYRSTRQIFGVLEMSADGQFSARFDMLNGELIQTANAMRPKLVGYVPDFPYARDREDDGPEIQLRAVSLWTAIHLASLDRSDSGAVLITVGKQINYYARDFVEFLSAWPDLPPFQIEIEPENEQLLQIALESCADYFSVDSHEYKLLRRGIVVHHGNLPSVLARHFTTLIDRRIVRIVIATSTLSEGVNLPFETILFPSLRDYSGRPMTPQYIRNVVGRAGRPGFAREGRALVLLGEGSKFKVPRQTYANLLTKLARESSAPAPSSSLRSLMDRLFKRWSESSGEGTLEDYLTWLEVEGPMSDVVNTRYAEDLDSLDEFLLSAIAEAEIVEGTDPREIDPEALFTSVWQGTYLRAITSDERYRRMLVSRGRADREYFLSYGDARRSYGSSLGPRAARSFLAIIPAIEERLREGIAFSSWDDEKRYAYLCDVLEAIVDTPQGDFRDEYGKRDPHWKDVLNWWVGLREEHVPPDSVGRWYKLANASFSFRFAWAINSVLLCLPRTALDVTLEDVLRSRRIPSLASWLRDMLLWGVLDPVDAAVLHAGLAITRSEARELRREYVGLMAGVGDAMYDPDAIREFIKSRESLIISNEPRKMSGSIPVDDMALLGSDLRVWPVMQGSETVLWRHTSGYPIAVTLDNKQELPDPMRHDFTLRASERTVHFAPYV